MKRIIVSLLLVIMLLSLGAPVYAQTPTTTPTQTTTPTATTAATVRFAVRSGINVVVDPNGTKYWVTNGVVDIPQGTWYAPLIADGTLVQQPNNQVIVVPTSMATATPGLYMSNSSVADSIYIAEGDVIFHGQTLINPLPDIVLGAASGNIVELVGTTGVFTTGTNVETFLNIDAAIGNATAGTNTVNGVGLDGITGDAQVTENAISVGSGWDYDFHGAGDAHHGGTVDIGAFLELVPGTAITVTQDGAIACTTSDCPLVAEAAVGTSDITVPADGVILILHNTGTDVITITDTGVIMLNTSRALGQYDTLMLKSDGTNLMELSYTNN